MKSVFYKRILLPTQDLTASVSSQPTTPTPTNPVAVSYTICGNYKLYGLTNYLDTFNATTKVITHKIGIKVLDGTENWTKRSDTGVNRYQANILNDKVSGTINGLSSHFVSVLAYSQLLDGCFILDATDRVVFDKEDITTASAFKSYLSQQYANGTPVIIYYPLATETTETATEPLQRVETKSFVNYKANPEYRNLPAGYTQVKYLQSSGTQWIDTGYAIAHEKAEIECKVRKTGDTGNKNWWGSAINNTKWFTTFSTNNRLYIGSSSYTIFGPSEINTDYVLKYATDGNGNITQTVDGVVGDTKAYDSSIISGETISLLNEKNSSNRICPNLRYYWFKITDNDVLVRDLVPCYNSNNVAGMYDLVNNVFYQNSGTGTFIVGEDVPQFIRVEEKGFAMYQLNPNWHDLPSDYTELEYLESSGTQWIDTGINAKSTQGIHIKYAYMSSSAETSPISASSANIHNVIQYYDNSRIYMGAPLYSYNFSTTIGTIYDLWINQDINNPSAKVNGTQLRIIAGKNNVFGTIDVSWGLFARKTDSSFTGKQVQIYEEQINDNNVVIQHLIPARNSNNILGMYDLVSGQFFTNSGTGTFIAGNVVPKYIKHGG